MQDTIISPKPYSNPMISTATDTVGVVSDIEICNIIYKFFFYIFWI